MDRNVPMEVGQSLYNEPMVNGLGILLPKGTVLMVDTSQYTQGNRLRVMPANASLPPDLLLGIAAEDIQINQEGFVVWFGNLTGTLSILQPIGETWAAGDLLYPHPTQIGRLTNVLPFNGKIKIPIAVIKRINGNNVLIKVRMRIGEYLRNITDVDLTSPANGSNLFYENGLWKDTLYTYLDSIVFSVPNYMSVSPSTLSNSGTVTFGFQPQLPNTVFAGPASGANASPTFRYLSQIDVNTAGGITGAGVGGQVSFYTGAYTHNGDNNFVWDNTAKSLSLGGSGFASSLLTLNSTTKGLLIPRLTTTQRTNITSPATGLMVYDLTLNQLQIWNGSAWTPSVAPAGTNGQVQFNNNGAFGASGQLAWDNTKGELSVGAGASPITSTTGFFNPLYVADKGFNPTSGNATYTGLIVSTTIDQTGTANGVTRGILVGTNIQSAADFRAIEWDNDTGWGLFSAGLAKNYIAGNMGIGTVSLHPSALLTLKSNNQGLLVPRMTTTEKNNIQGPETSLLLYDTDVNNYQYYDGSAWVGIVPTSREEAMIIASSDETTNLATLVAARTFRAPYAMRITRVKIDVNTAPVGQSILVDVNVGSGTTSLFTTRPEIEVNELSSVDATTQPVLNNTVANVANNALITIDIDRPGTTTPGKGLKVTIYYTRN
jgi:hypothetical protein